MDNTKYIEVVFENCESIVIPTERVLGLTYAELTPIKDDHALRKFLS